MANKIRPHLVNKHRTYQIIDTTTTHYINLSQNTNDTTSISYLTFDSSTNFDVNILLNPYVKKDTQLYLVITEDNFTLQSFNEITTFSIDSTTFFRNSKIYAKYV